MNAIRQRLWVKTEVGGILRYENDHYQQVSPLTWSYATFVTGVLAYLAARKRLAVDH